MCTVIIVHGYFACGHPVPALHTVEGCPRERDGCALVHETFKLDCPTVCASAQCARLVQRSPEKYKAYVAPAPRV